MSAALIIGGGRGIGLALVEALLSRDGMETVIATCRSDASAQALERLDDSRVATVRMDVTDPDGIEALAARLGDGLPSPSLVVHVAGILHEDELQPEKSLRQVSREDLRRVFDVNSIGPLLVASAVIPKLSKRGRVRYAMLSAMVGSIGDNRLGGWYGYRASKSALNQFMKTLSIECRRTHPELVINTIHPGTTDTDLSRPFQSNVSDDKLYTPEETATRILGVILGLETGDSGRFLNWDGTDIPW